MMKNKKTAAALCIFLNIIVIVLFVQINVSALQTGQSITIDCECGGVSVNNMEWKLYKVADIQNTNLTVTSTFLNYPEVFDLADLSTPEKTKSLAFALQSYVLAQKSVPDNTLKTSEDGTAVFQNLDNGCYLAVPDRVCLDDTVYYASPVLVCIDEREPGDSEPSCNVLIMAKIESQHLNGGSDTDITTENVWVTTSDTSESVIKTEDLPQTGQLWWPVPLLACSGTILLVTGWFLYFRKK